eukprot:snap_masked-scaffold_42-processed-gene-1.24-mRNA-1 protein AED:1.00 eAED:1.00 QI:0/0/0/0/1/1/2/0/62
MLVLIVQNEVVSNSKTGIIFIGQEEWNARISKNRNCVETFKSYLQNIGKPEKSIKNSQLELG